MANELHLALTCQSVDQKIGTDLHQPYYISLYKYLLQAIEKCLASYQVVWIHTDMDIGASTIWGFAGITMKTKYPGRVKISTEIPSQNQSATWSDVNQKNWQKIFSHADLYQVYTKSPDPKTLSLMHMGLVQKSDILIVLSEPKQEGLTNILTYAKSLGKKIKLLDANQFKEKPKEHKGITYW